MMTSSNGNMFRVIGHLCVWINGWVNNREAGDLRCYRAHYDVTVMHNKCEVQNGVIWIKTVKTNSMEFVTFRVPLGLPVAALHFEVCQLIKLPIAGGVPHRLSSLDFPRGSYVQLTIPNGRFEKNINTVIIWTLIGEGFTKSALLCLSWQKVRLGVHTCFLEIMRWCEFWSTRWWYAFISWRRVLRSNRQWVIV